MDNKENLTIWLEAKYGPFLDTTELSELLRIKKVSLYQKIYQGTLDIPNIKRGKRYLFPTSEVAKFFVYQKTDHAPIKKWDC